MKKPVIFLAFANELGNGSRYLRNLPKEQKQLRAIWEKAEEADLCELVVRGNITAEELFLIFEKPAYRDRIALFHFGGHADSFELLLNDFEKDDQRQTAHTAGLIPFLAGQRNLRLVFLNGCYTVKLAEALTQGGLSAVIGTVQAVNDELAAELSVCFYQALVLGLSVGQSWDNATSLIKTKIGADDFADYYADQEQRGATHGGDRRRFPWEMVFKKGAEEDIRAWNLPAAANNPLFGLPPLPEEYPLPDEPYQFLKRYEKEDAAIFFGRGRDLRQLYFSLVSEEGPPLVLLYGQSGVGKSSLLNAGLLPRLEQDYSIRIIRRHRELGLLGCLMEALDLEQPQVHATETDREMEAQKLEADIRQLEGTLAGLSGEARQGVEKLLQQYGVRLEQLQAAPAAASFDLRAAWREIEADSEKKAHLVILDQVEEVFTRANEDLPNELDDFLVQVEHIFHDLRQAPKGKLVLSYRKEYASDFEKAFRKKHIDREEIFLDKLDKQGIMEIVEGLSSTERLRRRYKLEIEPGLALLIANDLLMDKDSPVAPILQIILSRFWRREHQGVEPVYDFTIEEYIDLKEEGVYLGDFFDQQMEKLRAWEQEIERQVESSGLALDILNYHTTPLATAQSHRLEELRALYQHNEDILQDLLRKFKEEYLLTDVERQQTSLAHDTLAPVVHQRIRSSDYPGQRALRILENKMIDYERDPDTIIEEEDLALVERGAGGMRIWMPKEVELIEKSRRRRAELEAERRRNRRFRRIAVVAIAVLAVVASTFWYITTRQRTIAQADALYNEGRLELAENPTLGIRKMWTAYEQHPKDANKIRGAYDAYRQNLLYEKILRDSVGQLNLAAFSADGRYVAAAVARDNEVRLYDGQSGTLIQPFTGPANRVNALLFQGEDYLWGSAEDRRLYRWDLNTMAGPEVFRHPPGRDSMPVVSIALSPDHRLLATGHGPALPAYIQIRDLAGENGWQVISLEGYEGQVNALAFRPGHDMVYIGLESGQVLSRRLEEEETRPLFERDQAAHTLAIAPDGKTLCAGYADGRIFVWDLQKENSPPIDSLDDHSGAVRQLAFSPDGRFFLSGSEDKTAIVWETTSRQLIYRLRGHDQAVHSVAFTGDTHDLRTASTDGAVLRWPFPYPIPKLTLSTGRRIHAVAFSPGGEQLLAASDNRRVYVWKAPYVESKPMELSFHEHPVYALAISPDGLHAASGDRSGQAVVWEVNTGQVEATAQLHQGRINAMSFSHDREGLRLLSGSDDFSAVLWNWRTDGLDTLGLHGHHWEVTTVDFFPDNAQVITAGLDSLLIRWNASDGALIDQVQAPAEIWQAGFVPDGKTRYVVLSSNEVLFYPEKGESQNIVTSAHPLAWSPDGRFFYAASPEDCTLRAYTPAGYGFKEAWMPNNGRCRILSVAVQPGGQWVATGSRDGTVALWRHDRVLLDEVWKAK